MGIVETIAPETAGAAPLAGAPMDSAQDGARVDAAQIDALLREDRNPRDWPDAIKERYSSEVTQRIERDQGFLLLLGLLVCLATLLIDLAVNPAMVGEGAALRVLAVAPITFLGLIASSRNWKQVAAFSVGASLIAFAAVVVHLSLHLPPESSARYLAAAALLMGFANITLPFSIRGLVVFNLAYTAAAYLTLLVGGQHQLGDKLDFLVLLAIIGGATMLLAFRFERLRQNNFLLTLQARTTSLELMEANSQLSDLSYRDPLTGLPNRRFFKRLFTEMLEEQACPSEDWVGPLHRPAMLMIDIDHFKAFNDTHGHVTGDEALRIVGHELAARMQQIDGIAARFGGEEFVAAVCVPSREDAERIAEDIRAGIGALLVPVWPSGKSVITASIGAAIAPTGECATREDLIAHADAALYEAKRSGRDQVRAVEIGESNEETVVEAAE